MSGEGLAIVGGLIGAAIVGAAIAAALAAAIGVAAIAGVTYGAFKGAQAIAHYYREHPAIKEKINVKYASAQIESIISKINKKNEELQKKEEDALKGIYEKTVNEVINGTCPKTENKLSTIMLSVNDENNVPELDKAIKERIKQVADGGFSDVVRFTRQTAQNEANILETNLEKLEKDLIIPAKNEIIRLMEEHKQQFISDSNSILEMINSKNADDAARKAEIKSAVEAALTDAEGVITEYEVNREASIYKPEKLNAFKRELDNVKSDYKAERYEAALSTALDLTSKALSEIAALDSEILTIKAYCSQVTATACELKELIERSTSVSVGKGIIDDLMLYAERINSEGTRYNNIEDDLASIENLQCRAYNCKTESEAKELISKSRRLREIVIEHIIDAQLTFSNYYQRLKLADIAIKEMEKQGYCFCDARHESEVKSSAVNVLFYNKQTDGFALISLGAERSSDQYLTKLEIFFKDSSSDTNVQVLEAKRADIRKKIEQAILKKAGKERGFAFSCVKGTEGKSTNNPVMQNTIDAYVNRGRTVENNI